MNDKLLNISIQRGGELFVHVKQTLEFVDICQNENLVIIGIEGFKLDNYVTKPQLDIIADFSPNLPPKDWLMFKNQTNQAAKTFLLNFIQKKDLWFTFVTLTEKELTSS